MGLIYTSGALAIVAAVIVLAGKMILEALRNHALDRLKKDANLGVLDRANKEIAVNRRYGTFGTWVEAVSIVLVAASVFFQTIDAKLERMSMESQPKPVSVAQIQEEIAKSLGPLQQELSRVLQELKTANESVNTLTTTVAELNRRVKDLEEKVSSRRAGGDTGKGDGGGGGPGKDKPKPPVAPGGAGAEVGPRDEHEDRIAALEAKVDFVFRHRLSVNERIAFEIESAIPSDPA